MYASGFTEKFGILGKEIYVFTDADLFYTQKDNYLFYFDVQSPNWNVFWDNFIVGQTVVDFNWIING